MLKDVVETHELKIGDLISEIGYTMEVLAITEEKIEFQPTMYTITVINNITDNPSPYTRKYYKYHTHTIILN